MTRSTMRTFLPMALILTLATAGLPAAGVAAGGHGGHGGHDGHDGRPSAGRAGNHPAGPYGPSLVLGSSLDLKGYDIAVDADGTAFVGWVSATGSAANRAVHLCVLPPRATSCAGGVQTTPSLGVSSAQGLHVVVPAGGNPTLVWFHDTNQSVSGPLNAKVATATVVGRALQSATDVAPAPSFGSLLTVEAAPDGRIWAVLQEAPGSGNDLRVLPGLNQAAVTVSPPWLVNHARVAFQGSTAVMVLDRYGQIGDEVRMMTGSSTGFTGRSSLSKVDGTWTVGGAYDVAKPVGEDIRLVAPKDDASYTPRFAAFKGVRSGFGRFSATGDRAACTPSSHDLFADASRRLSDVSLSCSDLTVANMARAGKAGLTRFPVGGTPAGGSPQIASLPRGDAWVAWSRSTAGGGHTLLVSAVRLPALLTKKSDRASGNKLTVTGPSSCLPAVDATVKAKARRATGWTVLSKVLKLDGERIGGLVEGSRLTPGSDHELVGKAVFGRGGTRVTAKVTKTFSSCPS